MESNSASPSRSNSASPVPKSDGLRVNIHPLLKNIVPTPKLPKNFNPLKQRHFDSTAINPYLTDAGPSRKVRKGALQFSSGKYRQLAEKQRQQYQQDQLEAARFNSLHSKGLVADKVLGEPLYHQDPPRDAVEWWDAYYVNGTTYDAIDDPTNIVLDNEHAPVSIYIQHPVFVKPAYEKHLPGEIPMFLTKKELKRKRKNERQARFKAQQERIQKGLEPPPPPKVKLLNLMSVLTNEAIKDPTAVEKQVQRQVEAREREHLKQNEARKLTKDQIHEKHHLQREKDVSKGIFRKVYKVDRLQDPQHFFKVDKNAQQLELKGLCVVDKDMTLIVVEGGAKSLKFYDKLIMKRIDWTKSNRPEIDLKGNKVVKVWEGQMKDIQFQRWSVIKIKSEEELDSVLEKFRIDNYWREALVV